MTDIIRYDPQKYNIKDGYQLGSEDLRSWMDVNGSYNPQEMLSQNQQRGRAGYDPTQWNDSEYGQPYLSAVQRYDPNASWVQGWNANDNGEGTNPSAHGFVNYDKSKLPTSVLGSDFITAQDGMKFYNNDNVVYDPHYGWITSGNNIKQGFDWMSLGPMVVMAIATYGASVIPQLVEAGAMSASQAGAAMAAGAGDLSAGAGATLTAGQGTSLINSGMNIAQQLGNGGHIDPLNIGASALNIAGVTGNIPSFPGSQYALPAAQAGVQAARGNYIGAGTTLASPLIQGAMSGSGINVPPVLGTIGRVGANLASGNYYGAAGNIAGAAGFPNVAAGLNTAGSINNQVNRANNYNINIPTISDDTLLRNSVLANGVTANPSVPNITQPMTPQYNINVPGLSRTGSTQYRHRDRGSL